jgi:hypothetical protein
LQDTRVDPSKPSEDNLYPILVAVDVGDESVVEELMKHPKVDPSIDMDACLIKAAYQKKPKIIQLLIKDPRVNAGLDGNVR